MHIVLHIVLHIYASICKPICKPQNQALSRAAHASGYIAYLIYSRRVPPVRGCLYTSLFVTSALASRRTATEGTSLRLIMIGFGHPDSDPLAAGGQPPTVSAGRPTQIISLIELFKLPSRSAILVIYTCTPHFKFADSDSDDVTARPGYMHVHHDVPPPAARAPA